MGVFLGGYVLITPPETQFQFEEESLIAAV